MNATPLFLKDGRDSGVSFCSACERVALHDAANTCCMKGVCKDCGKETNTAFILKCFDCREKDRMDAAEKLEDWDGPVVYNDRYFDTLDDLLEFSDEGTLPEFVWVAETEHFPLLDAGDILEQFCEDLYEDAYDNLEGVEEFEAAVKAFNDANAKNTYWMESNKRAVKVPHRPIET